MTTEPEIPMKINSGVEWGPDYVDSWREEDRTIPPRRGIEHAYWIFAMLGMTAPEGGPGAWRPRPKLTLVKGA